MLSWNVAAKPCLFSISTVVVLTVTRESSEPVLNQIVFSPFFSVGPSRAAKWLFSQSATLPPKIPALNTPMAENRSRLANAMFSVCAPPMESPAMARCGRS